MSLRGLGDRWLAGEAIDGVAFGHGDAVRRRADPAGAPGGRIALLMSGPPDPLYLVDIEGGARPVRVRQSALVALAARDGTDRDAPTRA